MVMILSQYRQAQGSQLDKVVEYLEQIIGQVSAVDAKVYEIPRSIGYPFSGGVPDDHVWIHDSLGQKFLMPMDLRRSLKVSRLCYKFQLKLTNQVTTEVLEIKFRDAPGESRVKRGDFLMMDLNSHRLISSSEWTNSVRPGAVLAMAMLVSCWQSFVMNQCPSCKADARVGFDNWHKW